MSRFQGTYKSIQIHCGNLYSKTPSPHLRNVLDFGGFDKIPESGAEATKNDSGQFLKAGGKNIRFGETTQIPQSEARAKGELDYSRMQQS